MVGGLSSYTELNNYNDVVFLLFSVSTNSDSIIDASEPFSTLYCDL